MGRKSKKESSSKSRSSSSSSSSSQSSSSSSSQSRRSKSQPKKTKKKEYQSNRQIDVIKTNTNPRRNGKRQVTITRSLNNDHQEDRNLQSELIPNANDNNANTKAENPYLSPAKVKTLVQKAIIQQKFMRQAQRAQTIAATQMKVNSLEEKLQNEMIKKEELAKEKVEVENEKQFQMNHLQNEKLILIKQAEKKSFSIKNIQKKLFEEKGNHFDISTAKPKKESTFQFGFSFLYSIQSLLYSSYFLSSFSYKIANALGTKVYEHFAFLAFLLNILIFGGLLYLIVYIPQLVGEQRSQGISITFAYSFDASGINLSILTLIFLLLQAFIIFHKYTRLKIRSVREQAKTTANILIFKLALTQYNWKIRNKTQREKTQLSLIKRIHLALNQEEKHHHSLLTNSQKIKIGLYRFVGVTFFTLILFLQIIGVKTSYEQSKKLLSSYFISFSVHCLVTSLISQIGSTLINLMRDVEQIKGIFYKQLRIFLLQIIPCIYSLGIETLILFESQYDIPRVFHQSKFLSEKFNCPNEQLGYSITILMISYAVMAIVYSYATIMWCVSSKKCSDENEKLYSQNAVVAKYFFFTPFHSNEQTSPYFIVYFLAICAIPLNPFVIVLAGVILLIVYFHNYFQAQAAYLPQMDDLSQIKVKGVNAMFLSLSLFLATVYIIILFGTHYDLGSYVYKDKVYDCGPFERGVDVLSMTSTSLGGISSLLDIILWKPLILCLLIMGILLTLSFYYQMMEWKNQYKVKDDELRILKRFYSKEVYNLEDKINFAQQNIEDIVQKDIEDKQLEQYKKVTATQKTQVSANQGSIFTFKSNNNNVVNNINNNATSPNQNISSRAILTLGNSASNAEISTLKTFESVVQPKLKFITPSFFVSKNQQEQTLPNSNIFSNQNSTSQHLKMTNRSPSPTLRHQKHQNTITIPFNPNK